MGDDVQLLTARLAADPNSLAFLPLGEALRRRGQLDAALAIAERGAHRYPNLADAHDLIGRIHTDLGDGDAAFDAWTTAVRLEPEHAGAHKGLAYLAHRAGDDERALRHLEIAARGRPEDASLAAALDKTRARVAGLAEPTEPGSPPLEPGPPGTLLTDLVGRRLAGTVAHADGSDASDAVAAELSGISKEAARVAALLDLGAWESLDVEGPDARMHVMIPSADVVLLVVTGPDVPPGRLPLLAGRAAATARRWLEALR